MRYSKKKAEGYRKNGTLLIQQDVTTPYYNLIQRNPLGQKQRLLCDKNKIVIIKHAKRLAMERQLGFDETLDIF